MTSTPISQTDIVTQRTDTKLSLRKKSVMAWAMPAGQLLPALS